VSPAFSRGPGARRARRRRRVRGAAAVTLLLLAAACTERSITSPNEGSAPGSGTPTVEITIPADSMMVWRDTTYTGFATPGNVAFWIGANTDSLESRPLLRIAAIPDTLTIDSLAFVADTFRDAQLRLTYDTTDIVIPAGGTTFKAYVLNRSYDASQATWDRAADGQPWDSAGGDLGPLLATLTLKPLGSDSVVNDTITGDSELPPDSLLKAWRASGGGHGIIVVPQDAGTRVRFVRAVLASNFDAVHGDSVRKLYQYFPASGQTFIYSPSPPAPSPSELRVGGVPAGRGYFEFLPPDSVEGYRLRGAQISRAELAFQPLGAPAAPFRLERAVRARLTALAADFFQLGPKTPVAGWASAPTFSMDPDSLATGTPVRLDVTTLLRNWAGTPADSTPETIRLGLELLPDGQTLGYWSFGGVAASAGARPRLRLLVTPPVPFTVP